MQFNKKILNNVVIFYIIGRLDVHTSSFLETEIQSIIKEYPNHNLILNFNDVEYMSSTSIRILIHIHNELEKNGLILKICSMNSIVKEVLKITGLISSFEIFDNEEDALQSFQ